MTSFKQITARHFSNVQFKKPCVDLVCYNSLGLLYTNYSTERIYSISVQYTLLKGKKGQVHEMQILLRVLAPLH